MTRRQAERHAARALDPYETLGRSPAQLRRLAAQGVRAALDGPTFPPGEVVSVGLRRCDHRARVEVLANGHVPRRARCPQCLRWTDTRPETARPPLHPQPEVVAVRTEERDGRSYRVEVLAPSRRPTKPLT